MKKSKTIKTIFSIIVTLHVFSSVSSTYGISSSEKEIEVELIRSLHPENVYHFYFINNTSQKFTFFAPNFHNNSIEFWDKDIRLDIIPRDASGIMKCFLKPNAKKELIPEIYVQLYEEKKPLHFYLDRTKNSVTKFNTNKISRILGSFSGKKPFSVSVQHQTDADGTNSIVITFDGK